jgi:hypothetical protein
MRTTLLCTGKKSQNILTRISTQYYIYKTLFLQILQLLKDGAISQKATICKPCMVFHYRYQNDSS